LQNLQADRLNKNRKRSALWLRQHAGLIPAQSVDLFRDIYLFIRLIVRRNRVLQRKRLCLFLRISP